LERQQIMLESYCAAKGWQTETIKDLGSGMNYRKKGLKNLLDNSSYALEPRINDLERKKLS
jgi:predicted site-specific integrase-resolvase